MRLFGWKILLIGCLAVTGCGGAAPHAPTQKHLLTLTVFYGRYQGANRGRPPKDEAAFRKYIAALSPDQAAQFGVDPARFDDLFISPRDGKPYVVYYGRPGPSSGDFGAVIAHEAVGVGGRRMVAFEVGQVEELDDARFRALVPSS